MHSCKYASVLADDENYDDYDVDGDDDNVNDVDDDGATL